MPIPFLRRRLWRIVLALVIAIPAIGVFLGWSALHFSLAQLDGMVRSEGLTAAVDVTRDALGTPTIRAQNQQDASYVLGFVHAQERFFQMDLLRRTSAGELAELFGEQAVDTDKQHRLHLFRQRAQAAVNSLPATDRAILARYTTGVNAGLQALPSRPFEYWLLRTLPRHWKEEDSLLVAYALYLDLQGNQTARLFSRGWLATHTTAQQRAFLLPVSSNWDSAMDGTINAEQPAIPAQPPAIWGAPVALSHYQPRAETMVGSNGWVVSGKLTGTGHSLLANDMHLGLMLPTIWYKAVLQYPNTDHRLTRLVGLTLPGVPSLISGTNGMVAWGFTNSYANTADLIQLDMADKQHYRTANGIEPLQTHTETILVNHAAPITLQLEQTRWGPVIRTADQAWALHWLAYHPDAINLKLMHLSDAKTVDEALSLGGQLGIPAQNLMVADQQGHIGWTIAGQLPQRGNQADTSYPLNSSTLSAAWQGTLAPSLHPRLENPPSGLLWTANSRQLAGADYRLIGDGGADLGARSSQIRQDLQNTPHYDEAAMQSIQLDDSASLMQAWHQRLLRALTPAAINGHPLRAEALTMLKQWKGKATADSVGYRIVRQWRDAMYTSLFGRIDEQLQQQWKGADYRHANPRWDITALTLLDQQPVNWLPTPRLDWEGLQLQQLDKVLTGLTAHQKPLVEATWGEQNRANIAHPFARLLPWLRFMLAAPSTPLSGDVHLPHVVNPHFGASERLIVSPGLEGQAALTLPGGQSGNPLSPYFLAGHSDWVNGLRTPLLPGVEEHRLRFIPGTAPTGS